MGHDEACVTARARIGRVLKNKWRLVRVLAVGGMGAVYEAEHRNGKRVAVKMLHSELCRDPAQRKRFLREGYAANAIGDPRVVTVDDDDVDEDGSTFLVLELLEGELLDGTLKRLNGRVPVSIALPLMDQLLAVLEKAHAKRIVHRDIKPENLFLTSSGSLKVLDFGIARLLETDAATDSDTSITTVMGTPAYMAPEQARARWDLVDERTDLWSVGATLFRLLSGKYVHEAATRNEQLGLAMTAPARSLASVAPELPASVIAAVDRALAYDREERWQSARTMREALSGQPVGAAESATVPADPVLDSTPTIEPTSAPVVPAVPTTLPLRRPGLTLRDLSERVTTSRTRVAVTLGTAFSMVGAGALIFMLTTEHGESAPIVLGRLPRLPVQPVLSAVRDRSASLGIAPGASSLPEPAALATTRTDRSAGGQVTTSRRYSLTRPASPASSGTHPAPVLQSPSKPAPEPGLDPLDRRR